MFANNRQAEKVICPELGADAADAAVTAMWMVPMWQRAALLIFAATMEEDVEFTVTSTAISLVLLAPMCQGRLWHIDTTQGIHSLCLVQTTMSAVVEGEDSTGMLMATFQWLKPWFTARCH